MIHLCVRLCLRSCFRRVKRLDTGEVMTTVVTIHLGPALVRAIGRTVM